LVLGLLFVVTSMLAMGLSLTIPQIIQPLKNVRLVILALLANFVLVPLLACSECGAPTQTPVHRGFVRQRLPDHMASLLNRELCPSCARQRADRPAVGASGHLR
jgi:hypothetical protein